MASKFREEAQKVSSRRLQELLLAPDATIVQALQTIDKGSVRIALVVDQAGRLKGAVTDGDVRRGILRGIPLTESVSAVMNRTPTTVPRSASRAFVRDLMRHLSLHQIPVLDEEKRVVELLTIDELVAAPSEPALVLIMVGGLGSRLRPLTESTPKPMLPVGGRPLLETIVRNFESQGYRRILMSVNYKAQLIREHFGDGSALGVEIKYLVEEERLGTAGALGLMAERPKGPIIVMNGDLLTTVNFNQLVTFHREQGARATMCIRDYAFQVPYGVVETDGTRFSSIREKPVHQYFVNAGIYVLDPDVPDLVTRGTAIDMPEVFDRIKKAGGDVSVFPIREYWMDIGRVDDLHRAESEYGEHFGK